MYKIPKQFFLGFIIIIFFNACFSGNFRSASWIDSATLKKNDQYGCLIPIRAT